MAARLWGAIITRLTAPPLALKLHALLVLAAAFVAADAERRGWWAGPAFVAIVLWPLLRGSRLIWWAQLMAVFSAALQALRVNGTTGARSEEIAMFVDNATVVALVALLGIAWIALLLPPVRRYCRDEPKPPLRTWGFVVGAVVIAGFPTMALGIESWLPRTEAITDGGVFVGGDPDRRVAFYVEEGAGDVCFSIVWIDGGTRSCDSEERSTKFRFPFHAHGILAGVAADEVERVEVVFRSGARPATIIDDERVRTGLYYLLDGPPARELLRVVGYDERGAEVFRGPLH